MAAQVMAPEVEESKPQGWERRAERRDTRLALRMADTHSPIDQFAVAVDHFRATALDQTTDRNKAETAMTMLTQMLIDQANRIRKPRRKR